MAVAEANAKGGINGRKIEIDFQDNRCNPAEAVKSVTQMLSSKKYAAIFDGLCSSAALAIMPLVERAKVPFIIANASATSIAEKSGVGGNIWTFKVNPTDASMLDALVAWLDKEGKADNIAFLGEDTDYGRAGSAGFESALAKRGKKLVMADYFQKGTADYTAVLTKIKAMKPGMVAFYLIDADFQNGIKQWYTMGGGIPLTGRVLVEQVPKEILASGFLDGTTAVQPYDISVDTPANKAFVEAFTKRNSEAPMLISFESYETINILIEAIRQSGDASPENIRDALTRTKYQSMLGHGPGVRQEQPDPQRRDHLRHQGRQGRHPGHEQDLIPVRGIGTGTDRGPELPCAAAAERLGDGCDLRAGRHGPVADLRRARDRELRARRVLHAGLDAGLLPDGALGLRLLGDHPGRDRGRRRVGYVLFEGLLLALRGETFERSILLTMGLSMVLQNGAVFLFTTNPHLLESKLSYQNIVVGDFRMPVARLYALGLGIAAFAVLYLILHRTRIGKAMRGVAQNRAAADMVGIDARAVSRLAVAIGIGLTGLAGAALAPVYAVDPLMGFNFVFKAFAIIIIGGLGNISGAAIAAVMLGVIESLAGGLLPLAFTDAVAFLSMIAVLLLRPQGLFGRGVRV